MKLRKTDTQKALRGVAFKLEDAEFRIAKYNNPYFLRLVREKRRELTGIAGNLTPDQDEQVMCEALAEGVWLGFKNLQDEHGKDIEDTYETRLAMLRDPECRDLREWISSRSMESAAFERAIRQRAGKN